MEERDLNRNLERLSERGDARGAHSVFEAARGRAGIGPVRRFAPAIAIAAAVFVVAGTAAAIVATRSGPTHEIASHSLPTTPSPASSTTEGPAPAVSIPARLIAASRLVPFSNCGTFTSYMRTEALKVVSPYGLPGTQYGGPVFATGAAAGNAESKTAAPAPQAASSSPNVAADTAAPAYSTTNVQEAGIDEPDVVKTDGKRIYALSNGRLYVVDAASPKILGSIEVGNASEMFVVGDRAVIFSGGGYAQPMAANEGTALRAGPGPVGGYQQQARVLVVDVKDAAAMKEVSHVDVQGAYVSARLVNDVARIVFTSTPSNIEFTYPTDGSPEAQQAALDKNKAAVRDAKFDDWVAHYTVTDSAGRPSAAKPLVTCGAAYRPPSFSGFGQISVMSLDPKNPTAAKTTSVAADGQTVYASATRLFVATTQWGEVKPVQNGAPTVAQPASAKTLVHDFDISDATQARYLMSGSVRGTVLNQFSLSDFNGNLRVATTDGDQSYVTVFGEQSGALLGQLGQIGGLGKGERIYAVRFIGPLGYVVTYKQVDPLYVVDLRDPSKPRVVGALEVQGFSAYLHPISDTLLIGIGQDAGPNSPRDVAQVSLFDVSNPAAPKLVQRLPFGSTGSYSNAEQNHHAFLWWAPKQLAVVPLSQYDGSGQGFNGAVGVRVATSGIKEVGRVSHQNDTIERSLVIGDRLFTFSPSGLKASNLDTFQEEVFVTFGSPCCSSSSGGSSGTSGGESVPPSPPS